MLRKYPLSLAVLLAIVYLSLFNPPATPVVTRPGFDKLAHFLMYAGFCSVLWFEYLKAHAVVDMKRIMLGAIVCPVLFSGAMEVAQSTLTKYRTGDWFDFLFNSLGVLAAALFGMYVTRPLVRRYWRRGYSK